MSDVLDEFPTAWVKSYRDDPADGGKFVVVKCPTCGGLHNHGLAPDEIAKGYGHRAPHCDGSVPFDKRTDYVIRWTEGVLG